MDSSRSSCPDSVMKEDKTYEGMYSEYDVRRQERRVKIRKAELRHLDTRILGRGAGLAIMQRSPCPVILCLIFGK